MTTLSSQIGPTATASTCIVGMGGVFGDDRSGWHVIERLRELLGSQPETGIHLLKATTAADLLQITAKAGRIIIVDACCGLTEPGQTVRLNWPTSRFEHMRHSCGHNVTLPQALQIVAGLGNLPSHCEVRCIEGRQFHFDQPLSTEVEAAAELVAAQILREVRGV